MPESTARRSSHEKYQFTWAVTSEQSAKAAVAEASVVDQAVPSAFDSSVENGPAEPVDQLVDAIGAEQATPKAIHLDEGTWKTFHNSPKSKRRSGSASPGLSVRARIGAIAGWSCLAGTGAVLILMNPGTILALRLSVLGAAWAGISAAVWVLPSKLK
jgi:hypothetical protein